MTDVPMGGFTLQPGTPGAQYRDLIMGAAQQYNVPWQLLANVLGRESNFNPNLRGPVNSRGEQPLGMGQFMPNTFRDVGITNPFDPRQSIYGAAQRLGQMAGPTLDWMQAVVGYNRGPGRIETEFDRYRNTGFTDWSALHPEAREYIDHTMRGVVPREQMPQQFRDLDARFPNDPTGRRNFTRGGRADIEWLTPAQRSAAAGYELTPDVADFLDRTDWRLGEGPGGFPAGDFPWFTPGRISEDVGGILQHHALMPNNLVYNPDTRAWEVPSGRRFPSGTGIWSNQSVANYLQGAPEGFNSGYLRHLGYGADPNQGLINVPGHGWVGPGYAAALIAQGPGITHFPGSGPYGPGTTTINTPFPTPPPPPPPPTLPPIEIAPSGTNPPPVGSPPIIFSPSGSPPPSLPPPGNPPSPYDVPIGPPAPITPIGPMAGASGMMGQPAAAMGSFGGSHDMPMGQIGAGVTPQMPQPQMPQPVLGGIGQGAAPQGVPAPPQVNPQVNPAEWYRQYTQPYAAF